MRDEVIGLTSQLILEKEKTFLPQNSNLEKTTKVETDLYIATVSSVEGGTIKEFFIKLANNSNLTFFSRVLDEINKNLSRYLRGQGLICLLLAIYYGLCLYFISLEFGLVLELLSAFSDFS